MREFVIKSLATGFGFGLSPLFPGTPGTVPGVIIAWFLFPAIWWIGDSGTIVAIATTIGMLAVGVWAADGAEQYYGHDARKITIDEVAGVMVAYLFVPHLWQYYLTGFIIFRILDIIKPYPANKWEGLRGGWGVMADDFAVGVYTNIILQILVHYGVWL